MHGELADQQFAAVFTTVGCQAGQRQAVMDELAVQGGQDGAHEARIAKGEGDIK